MPDPSTAVVQELVVLGRDIAAVSLLRGDFVLSSGARSSYYMDKYLFETRPDILRRIATAFVPHVSAGTDLIAGTELGAIALATALSLATDLPFVIARKTGKGYSTEKLVEGTLEPGQRIVLVEDVITSGAQAIRAAERLTEAGGVVTRILGVIDREEGGRTAIESTGLSFVTLFTRTSLGLA